MEVHRQACQKCGSRQLNNIVARPAGEPTLVFARCADCGELVACYELRRYYHHGKDVESYIRSHGPRAAESGRNVLAQFDRVQRETIEWYEKVLKALEEQGKPL